jgi:hypothetical protein
VTLALEQQNTLRVGDLAELRIPSDHRLFVFWDRGCLEQCACSPFETQRDVSRR